MRRLLPSLLVLCFVTCTPASAAEPKRDHHITVDDYFTQADLFECTMSPDGKHVAYTEGRWQQSTNDRKQDLWVVDTQTHKSTRLTFERASDHDIKWSPDSKWIYFVGSRKHEGSKQPPYDGNTQVWRISPEGGSPAPVTQVENGIGLFDLSRDGKTLYYTTEKEDISPEWQHLQQQFKEIQYGHGIRKPMIVWKLDLENWRADKAIDEGRVIRQMALSPDSHRLAMITTPDDTVLTFEGQSRIDVFDDREHKVHTLPDKVWRADAPSPYGWLEQFAWSHDSQALAFTIVFDGYPAEIIVAEWTGDQPSSRKIQRPDGLMVKGYGSPVQWRGTGRDLLFLGEQKGRVRLCSVTGVQGGGQGDIRTLTPGDIVVAQLSFDPSGQHGALIMNDATHLMDIYLLQGDAGPQPITHVNPQADRWLLPQISIVSWKGAKGDDVEGILELPADYQPGQRLPLVLEIHGGPATSSYIGMQFWIYGRTLLPSKGYAVLSPNYRGSTGYGDRFLTDLIGHENNLDVEDILKGVDALVERGIADPDRLGVSGWSNGGYLTNCIISKTTRFKAASSGAGIVDTIMEWGANDEPAYSIVLKGGFPWSKPDNYHRASSTYQLEQIRTPTLIHVGGNDERCPPGHSRMLYRALKHYLHVPTELLVYPGEPHGLTKYQHRKAKMEWDLAWYDKYIRGKTGKESAAASTNSPASR